jgi:hypothetical protein
MTETMLALGPFRFAMDTAAYQSLRRSVEYRWPSQARFGRRPARQFVGIGDETINSQGIIYPEFKGGLKQLDTMRDLAGQGKAQILTDGTGKVWGKWCIISVKETQTLFFADGTPRKQEFSLQLGYYGEDS